MYKETIDQFSDFVKPSPSCPKAQRLQATERQQLGTQMIVRKQTVTEIAQKNEVSRKFLYKLQSQAQKALYNAFNHEVENDKVLFYLPVTKKWLVQFVLALVLICHSSFRGVIETLRDLFDINVSIGSVHYLVRSACSEAKRYSENEDLSAVKVGLHDEIFQSGKPVLAGIEAESTYCYFLSKEDHRDETTWGTHLLDLQNKGLNPEYTIADAGTGLRAGQKAAWDNVPCHGDIFHAQREFRKLTTYLENQAYKEIGRCEILEQKAAKARRKKKGQTFSKKLALARQKVISRMELSDSVAILSDWLKSDILSLAGDNYDTRVELYDYVIDELRAIEHQCPYRIKPVRTMLENQKLNLLDFAMVLEQKLAQIALSLEVAPSLIQEICKLHGFKKDTDIYWQKYVVLQQALGEKFHDVLLQVLKAMKQTPRASSLVENLNSRLRNYFFLRRHLGNEYLELLRFFLNHRRFMRSDVAKRQGKSPAELLNGQSHPHWLEILGFELFKQPQAA